MAEKSMTSSLAQNMKEKWKRRTGKQCWIADFWANKMHINSSIVNVFHLHQIVVQLPKGRRHAPLDVLRGVETASSPHVLGSRKPIWRPLLAPGGRRKEWEWLSAWSYHYTRLLKEKWSNNSLRLETYVELDEQDLQGSSCLWLLKRSH